MRPEPSLPFFFLFADRYEPDQLREVRRARRIAVASVVA